MKVRSLLPLLTLVLAASVAPLALGNSLSVTPQAAMNGTDFGMQVDLDGDDNGAFVVARIGDQETLTTELFLDLSEATLSKKKSIILIGYGFGPFRPIFEVRAARKGNGKPLVKLFCYSNSGARTSVGGKQVNRPVLLGVEFAAASSSGASDGVCRLSVDGGVRAQRTNLQNGNQAVSSVRMGVVKSRRWNELAGPVYFDEFVARK